MISELIKNLPESQQKEWTEALKKEKTTWAKGKANGHGLLSLPRDEQGNFLPFEGKSGKLYVPVNESGIGWTRLDLLEQYRMVRAFGLEPDELIKKQDEGVNTFLNPQLMSDGSNLRKGTEHFQSIKLRMMDATRIQMNYSFLICALMTRGENEDMSTWDDDIAKQKREDWSIYAVADFFFLSMQYLGKYQTFLKGNLEAHQKLNKKFWEGISSFLKTSTEEVISDPSIDGQSEKSQASTSST